MIHEPTPKFQSKSIDSCSALCSPNLNNDCDMRSPDQSFDLNRIFGEGSQIISELNDSWSRSKVPI